MSFRMGHNGFTANGQQCLNYLSQQTGQTQSALNCSPFGYRSHLEIHSVSLVQASTFCFQLAIRPGYQRLAQIPLSRSGFGRAFAFRYRSLRQRGGAP